MASVRRYDSKTYIKVNIRRGKDEFVAHIRVDSEEAKELMEQLQIAFNVDVDSMIRWQREATQVMEGWDECYEILELAGHPAPVGRLKSQHVAQFLLKAVHKDDA